MKGRWCLDPGQDMSPGQSKEIERIYRVYPDMNDDGFVKEHLHRWLA
jgi:hypothetical protein